MAPLSLFRYLRMVRFSLFHTKDQPKNYTLFNSTVRLIMNGTKRKSTDRGDISPPPLKRKAIGTATNKTVANFFTPVSQKKPEQVTWRTVNNSCIIGKYHQEQALEAAKSGKKRRIAAFDLDSTLIATKSGRRFPTNERDWKWWSPSVPDKLKQLNDEGYLVVVLSNQKAISLKKDLKGGRVESKSLSIFKQKVAAIMQTLDMPFSVYAATASDEFRKPRMGMWREMLDDHGLSVAGLLDLEQSIFVGDAAGREGDHSCVDRDFAANVGVAFETPEEFFLDEAPKPILRAFDPKAYIVDSSADEPTITFSKKSDVELVIFCGSPGSGKSTFYWRYLEPLGYERVNQDILKSRPKCLKVAKEYLQAGKSVAVDNTNAGPETRAYWIDLAKETNVPIRCIYLSTPPQICKHNDAVRAANPMIESINPESRSSLPGIAFGDFQRRFQVPMLSEGFQDITHVEFKFQGTPATKEVWGQYWV
ncbi:polynucleotide kinase [Histoplasma ohiense]|nr:polynucleotide kinase [Histoplasma ohiense (nom. inval.)]